MEDLLHQAQNWNESPELCVMWPSSVCQGTHHTLLLSHLPRQLVQACLFFPWIEQKRHCWKNRLCVKRLGDSRMKVIKQALGYIYCWQCWVVHSVWSWRCAGLWCNRLMWGETARETWFGGVWYGYNVDWNIRCFCHFRNGGYDSENQ